MSRALTADRRFKNAVDDLEEDLPVGRIPIDKQRRGKSSSATFRAGRGGRAGAKVQVKRYRAKPFKANCMGGRRR